MSDSQAGTDFESWVRAEGAGIVLRYFEGRSDAEIAAALDCSPATVRSQIHRALATLRGRLTLQQEVEQA